MAVSCGYARRVRRIGGSTALAPRAAAPAQRATAQTRRPAWLALAALLPALGAGAAMAQPTPPSLTGPGLTRPSLTRPGLEAPLLPGDPFAGLEGTATWTRLSAGAVFRTKPPDRGLIGISNGGTAQTINQDDGNRNFDPGLILGGLRGQTEFRFRRDMVEGRLNAVYYTNFTDDRGVVPERGPFERSFGTGGYLNEAYLGVVGTAFGAEARLRAGNQILRWGGTSFLNFGLNVPNPYQFARIYLPGAGLEDGYKAMPMLTGRLEWAGGAAAEAFWKFDFAPDLGSPNGWLGSLNDVYTPGSRAFFLAPGVPDGDVSVTTASPIGSRVPRAADRVGDSLGQVGLRLRSPDLFGGTTNLWLYSARFTDPEGVASTRTGTQADLVSTTTNYAAASRYFADYRSGVGLIGAAADVQPAPYTLLRVEYALRLAQPLQVQTGQTVGAAIAPAAVAGACGRGQQASPACAATLRTYNANQLIRRAGGITAANFGRFFGTEIDGGSRHDVSLVTAELTQGIGRPFGSDGVGVSAGFGGMYVHGYDPDTLALDSQISGRTTQGFGTATRWSWGYRLGTRATWSGLPGMERLRATAAYLHDVEGLAPNQMQLFTKGSKRLRLMLDAELGHGIAASLVWQVQLNRNGFGGLLWDRDYAIAAVSWRF